MFVVTVGEMYSGDEVRGVWAAEGGAREQAKLLRAEGRGTFISIHAWVGEEKRLVAEWAKDWGEKQWSLQAGTEAAPKEHVSGQRTSAKHSRTGRRAKMRALAV
jgi:hypothetical protein